MVKKRLTAKDKYLAMRQKNPAIDDPSQVIRSAARRNSRSASYLSHDSTNLPGRCIYRLSKLAQVCLAKNRAGAPPPSTPAPWPTSPFSYSYFFLVTTTIAEEKGVLVKLPEWSDKDVTTDMPDERVLTVLVNKDNELMVEDEVVALAQVPGLVASHVQPGKADPRHQDRKSYSRPGHGLREISGRIRCAKIGLSRLMGCR